MDFFRFNFYLNRLKLIKKVQKARESHAGATWHARACGRVTRTRAAPTWRVLYIYSLFILHIV